MDIEIENLDPSIPEERMLIDSRLENHFQEMVRFHKDKKKDDFKAGIVEMSKATNFLFSKFPFHAVSLTSSLWQVLSMLSQQLDQEEAPPQIIPPTPRGNNILVMPGGGRAS